MSGPAEFADALIAVEMSAARLEQIGQTHDEEFQRLLNEIALDLRLIARFFQAARDLDIASTNTAA